MKRIDHKTIYNDLSSALSNALSQLHPSRYGIGDGQPLFSKRHPIRIGKYIITEDDDFKLYDSIEKFIFNCYGVTYSSIVIGEAGDNYIYAQDETNKMVKKLLTLKEKLKKR